jgi:DNA-binding response OmpR family regulator
MAKVLLATDSGPPHTWSLLRVFLESAGYDVRAVHDGEAVLSAVPSERPEALILDTALPTLDGFQVLARLQRQPKDGRPPVLVISGIAPQLGEQLASTLGASAYLCKPFTFEALQQALEALLGARGNGRKAAIAAKAVWPANGTATRTLRPVARRQRRGAS